MGARVGRAATFLLPVASVLVAALVFLGPGALRPALGARVRGLPAEGAHAVAVRVEVVKSLYEVVDVAGVQELLVEGTAPGQTLRAWHGSTGPDGIAEVTLTASAPLRGPVAVAVTALGPHPKLLAGGEMALGPPPRTSVQLGRLAGGARGDLEIHVDVSRGYLAAPFPEAVRVTVSPRGLDTPLDRRAEIELSGPGLDFSETKRAADAHGVALFRIKALAHQVDLTVTARLGDKSAVWEGTLPVVPGAMWLSPPPGAPATGGPLALLSPAPRERAYVSFWTEEGRVAGAIVPLARDPLGFYAGEVTPPDLPGARILYATLAGDPVEQGAGTVAWPIRPDEGAVVPQPLALLLDGLPTGLDREKQRASATRRAGLWLIGAAALAEVLLLLVASRASQRKLEAHLIEASGPMPEADRARLLQSAREHPVLRALLAVSLVGLSFAMVAALSTFR
jgi:hypothetical protein